MKLFKIDVPWLLAQVGARKWLKERALHIPEAVLPAVCARAGVTPADWRKVEETVVALLYGAVVPYTDEAPK